MLLLKLSTLGLASRQCPFSLRDVKRKAAQAFLRKHFLELGQQCPVLLLYTEHWVQVRAQVCGADLSLLSPFNKMLANTPAFPLPLQEHSSSVMGRWRCFSLGPVTQCLVDSPELSDGKRNKGCLSYLFNTRNHHKI